MIKKGDNVICIDDTYHVGHDIKLPCKLGEICTINDIQGKYVIMFGGNWLFSLNNKYSCSYFFNYFIPISELRERQIKSVLDD